MAEWRCWIKVPRKNSTPLRRRLRCTIGDKNRIWSVLFPVRRIFSHDLTLPRSRSIVLLCLHSTPTRLPLGVWYTRNNRTITLYISVSYLFYSLKCFHVSACVSDGFSRSRGVKRETLRERSGDRVRYIILHPAFYSHLYCELSHWEWRF